LPANQREAFLAKYKANPAVLQNWVQLTRAGNRQTVAVFGVWTALSRVPAARFQQQASRVLANQYQPERAAVLSPVVLQAFRGRSFGSLEEVANRRYGAWSGSDRVCSRRRAEVLSQGLGEL
jgi:hypothetical protein